MNKINKKNNYICMTGSRVGANCSRISHATKAGFSLVEALLSLVVLSVGISAVTVLMMTNTKNSINTRNQIIASELAQEGLELVRNLKDNNATFSTEVGSGVYRTDFSLASTYADFKGSPTNYSGDANKRMYMNGGFFSHNAAGTATNFYRKINVEVSGGNTTVTSFVIWKGSAFPVTCTLASSCVSSISMLPN